MTALAVTWLVRRGFVFGWRRSVVLVACVGLAGIAAVGFGDRSARASSTSSLTTLDVGGVASAPPIPIGFAGLSLEYTTVEDYLGKDPSAVDPVFEQLVRNVAPKQRPVLRIGGDTTDWTWWPVPGTARPPWVRYSSIAGGSA